MSQAYLKMIPVNRSRITMKFRSLRYCSVFRKIQKIARGFLFCAATENGPSAWLSDNAKRDERVLMDSALVSNRKNSAIAFDLAFPLSSALIRHGTNNLNK